MPIGAVALCHVVAMTPEPGVPHEVFNVSDTDPVVAVVARSDASEWENSINYDRENEGPVSES